MSSPQPRVGPAARSSGLPLRRPRRGRWAGGVAAGLAAHLAVDVRLVRLAFVALTLVAGTGPALYLFLWLFVPEGDPAEAVRTAQPVSGQRLSRTLQERFQTIPIKDVAVGVLLVTGAALLIADRTGYHVDVKWVLPTMIVAAGAALAWSQLDSVERGRWLSRAGGRTPNGLLQLVGGLLLVLVGVLLLVGGGRPWTVVVDAAVAAVAVIAGLALVLAPWWVRLVRQLRAEQEARARESERADIAAHLHDSVLQTLALIRRSADRPEHVARLARAQERELREWLYADRPPEGTSIAAALRAVVAEVEDGRRGDEEDAAAAVIDMVVVGDGVPTAATTALLQATREALVNAVAHGRPPVSLYLEVSEDRAEVFVRDRGEGFDLDQVPSDRFGVRESIFGRVRRRGGEATITCRPERGTEVHLNVPIERDDPVGAPMPGSAES